MFAAELIRRSSRRIFQLQRGLECGLEVLVVRVESVADG